MKRLPSIYVPHGAGPCFFMDWTMGPADTWMRMEQFLRKFEALVPARPKAALVISGHHESDVVELTRSPTPSLIFDYYGFPPHTYELTYPAPGSPALAERAGELLSRAGIDHRLNERRGLDHGVFIPFLLMYPNAELPVVQMSLRSDLDAEFHLLLGEAISGLRDEGVLIVGSGMSYHNMGGYGSSQGREDSRIFDAWLARTCASAPDLRRTALSEWTRAPSGRASHPREEHLLPLMVVAGAGGDELGEQIFVDEVLEARVSAFGFGLDNGS